MPLLASASLGSWVRHVPSATVIDSGEFSVPAAGALNSAVMLLPPRSPRGFGHQVDRLRGLGRARLPLPARLPTIIAIAGRP